ncbi:MAG: phosphoribosylanthranilate isomerase [Clostridium sp.]|nr:phosphoribosylanthranilate isomerase [Acetatifactor muris]MCM1527074.1 phosphoribosylanthranilate isomerase [Bacteroides sp.]MCM1562050.1 phosphoribosylanthranilate isomerase [Clostridium sp.]
MRKRAESAMRIKICGLTDVREAEYLNKNQVDYAGIVLFYEKSKRNMCIEEAKPILSALSPGIQKVAVMVSPTESQVRQAAEAGFDLAQVHGELHDGVTDVLPVWKAFNMSDMNRLDLYRRDPGVTGYVFDAWEPGSGKPCDWNMLRELSRDAGKLFMLAGGLRAENVADAIRFVRPDGVDVSSGVEYADRPGKDPERVDAFVASVRGSR